MSTNPWETSNKSLFITQKEHEKLISDLVLRLEECTKRIDVLEAICFSSPPTPPEHELFYEKVYIKNPMAYPFHDHTLTIDCTAATTPASISSDVIA